MPRSSALVLLMWVAACASTPGARPHEMSAAEHEAAAAALERGAAEHQAEYAPGATSTERRCGVRSTTHGGGVCWTSTVNPTARHLEEADELRAAAGEHRAASRALEEAEARACAGLSPDDRDISPFAHTEDIRGVEPLQLRGHYPRLVGATVFFRAVPGMSVESLQRLVDCHLARNAVLGHDLPEMSFCPLQPKGVSARVREGAEGFAVDIAADERSVAEEVLRRAQALLRR